MTGLACFRLRQGIAASLRPLLPHRALLERLAASPLCVTPRVGISRVLGAYWRTVAISPSGGKPYLRGLCGGEGWYCWQRLKCSGVVATQRVGVYTKREL